MHCLFKYRNGSSSACKPTATLRNNLLIRLKYLIVSCKCMNNQEIFAYAFLYYR